MIPKIIHQTYKHKTPLPETYKTCQDIIVGLHPDFEYMFWADDSMFDEMKTSFPDYFDAFMKLPRTIMRIDMFRYFLMYKYGGIYSDLDYFMLKPFDLLDHNVVIPCNREDENGTTTCLGNCIFASQPNHPFWKMLMDSLWTFDRNDIEYKRDDVIINSTGPKFVYTEWVKYSKNHDDIHIPCRALFHPHTTRNISQINDLKKKKYAYGIHLCEGLWMNNKL